MTATATPGRPADTIDADLLGPSSARQFWSVFRLLWLPLRSHPAPILGLSALTALAVLVLSFAMKVKYSSGVSFFVDRSSRAVSLPSGLAAIGKQLGLGDLDSGQPPDFYAWLASSDDILATILLDTVPPTIRRSQEQRRTPTMWDQLYGHAHPEDATALAKAVKQLRKDIHARVDLPTSLINIEVSAPSRELAMDLGQRVFAEINRANTQTRQTRASNELRFLRAQQRAAADSL